MGESTVGISSSERVFEIFLRGEADTIASVSRMLECRRFWPIASEENPEMLVVRSPAFRDPKDDAEIREFGDLLCAGLRTVAFALSGAEIIVRCVGFRIYFNKVIERTVAWSNEFRVQGLGPNWLDQYTAEDQNGNRIVEKAVAAALASEQLRLVMHLCSTPDFGWREIYDVIDAIGRREICARYGMTKAAIDRIMRTANSHRHRGGKQRRPDLIPVAKDEALAAVQLIVRRFVDDEIGRLPVA
jgi:hypothetical protein